MESKFVSRFFMSCGYIWFVNQVETNFETIIIFVFVAMYGAVMLSSASNVLIFRASFVTTNETNNFLSILLPMPMPMPKLKKIRCRIFVRHNHRIQHLKWRSVGTFYPVVCIFSICPLGRALLSDFLYFMAISWRCTCVVCSCQFYDWLRSQNIDGKNVNNSDFRFSFLFWLVFLRQEKSACIIDFFFSRWPFRAKNSKSTTNLMAFYCSIVDLFAPLLSDSIFSCKLWDLFFSHLNEMEEIFLPSTWKNSQR